MTTNIVYVGTSLDGYIADRDGGLEFLECVPNPDGNDFGFQAFMESVDAILMGRVTFEVVEGFGCDWPYAKPVFVWSATMSEVPEGLVGKVELVWGELKEIVAELGGRGFERVYIDGGRVVQSFLKEDMVDEMIIARVPILLGGGISLFDELPDHQEFEHITTEIHLDAVVQSHYRRRR